MKRYAPAMRACLIARRRLQTHEADDLLQAFLTAKVVEEGFVGHADRNRGRFRTFLLTALDRFVSNELRRDRAQKRGFGAVGAIGDVDDLATGPGPDQAFDAAWAREVIAQATRQMRDRCQSDGRSDVWSIFEARVLAPIADGGEPTPYEQLVTSLNLSSVSAANNLLVTAKRAFARALRAVIGEYESDPDAIEDEIHELARALSSNR
jgi:RNA polymerase sigma-70 factor (ECF subfamily)